MEKPDYKSDIAIQVNDITKIYKLFARYRDRLIDAFGLSKTKHYREHYALKNISFDVKRGECVGLIGTNGAGKSTILKIITGVLTPTRGEVIVNGRISALLELGAGFNMEYTGIENVYLNGTMIGFSREEIDKKLDSILEFADIGDFVYQPVKTYSSGMFVRLAFAIAINIDPEILIVDEALSVGDVYFQAKCYRKFEEFKNQGKTILFVSHDLSSIQKYCDRAILFNQGEKISEGTPKFIIDLYKRVLVGDDAKAIAAGLDLVKQNTEKIQPDENLWKSHLTLNPNTQEYGDKKAEIVDYALIDDTGKITDTLIKGKPFTVKLKIKTYEDITDPIIAFTIRNLQGQEITGTNTMVERTDIGTVKGGRDIVISFKQKLTLQGGPYLLALGLTRFDNDDFHVYHRLYDCISMNVVSVKNTVGYYDVESEIEYEVTD